MESLWVCQTGIWAIAFSGTFRSQIFAWNSVKFRQQCRLTICWYFCWVWQIVNQKQNPKSNMVMRPAGFFSTLVKLPFESVSNAAQAGKSWSTPDVSSDRYCFTSFYGDYEQCVSKAQAVHLFQFFSFYEILIHSSSQKFNTNLQRVEAKVFKRVKSGIYMKRNNGKKNPFVLVCNTKRLFCLETRLFQNYDSLDRPT